MLKKYPERARSSSSHLILWGLLSIFLLGGIPAPLQSQSSIQMYFFYAEDCQPCQAILHSYLPTLKTMFPSIEVRTFDVGNPAYYEALGKIEEKFKKKGEELPVVFIGDHLLSGEREVMEQLEPSPPGVSGKRGASLPPIQIPSITQSSERLFRRIWPIFIRRDVRNATVQTLS